jgi:hypothetical protein
MVRRTVNLPESVDELVREVAEEGESFSAAVTRLVEAGARALQVGKRPRYVASGEGPEDLGRKADEYLSVLASAR